MTDEPTGTSTRATGDERAGAPAVTPAVDVPMAAAGAMDAGATDATAAGRAAEGADAVSGAGTDAVGGAGAAGTEPAAGTDPAGTAAAGAGSAGTGAGSAQRDEEAVSRFVERFASELVEAGMPRMPSRVFAALLASPEGVMTSAELGDSIRISPAAVSGAIRYLTQVNMVSREREPGSRRDRYRVHSNQWYEALTNRDAVLRRWEGTLREGVVSVGPDSKPGRRIAETLEFFDFMQRELTGMMERWREHRDRMFGGQ